MEKPALSLNPPSLVDAVYENLLEAIVSGRLATGAELNAAVLARRLQVSRTPVLGAIRRLSGDGLAVQEPGRKARVAGLTIDDLREYYELRMLLEPEAAALAVERISEETLRWLAEVGQELIATTTTDAAWLQRAIDYDRNFHRAIAEASGSGRLRDAVLRYRLLVISTCRKILNVEIRQQCFREQQAVVAALMARDRQAARDAMHAHLSELWATVARSLPVLEA